MGYRSDVHFCSNIESFNKTRERLHKKLFEAINLNQINSIDDYNILRSADSLIINKEKDYVLIEWNSVKWNEFYKDVKIFEEVLQELVNEDDDFTYKCIEVGEDSAVNVSESDGFSDSSLCFYENIVIDVNLDSRDESDERIINPQKMDIELATMHVFDTTQENT